MELPYSDLRRHLLCLPDSRSNYDGVAARVEAETRVSEYLRNLFASPLSQQVSRSDIDNQVARGVLVEFGVQAGTDAFSAFSDGWIGWFDSARKSFVEGRVTAGATTTLRDLMDATCAAFGDPALARLEASPVPEAGKCTVSVISPSGIAFGIGDSRSMATDQLGAPIIRSALNLRLMLLQGR